MAKYRKCIKCGSSAMDPDVSLFRFPKPGRTNASRCEAWARICFPDEKWFSHEFQQRLYNGHKMLCNKHFRKTSFDDYPKSNKKLHRCAVPDAEKCVKIEPIDPIPHPEPSNVCEPLEIKICGIKREWSSDEISPSLEFADKKVCLEGGTAAVGSSPTSATGTELCFEEEVELGTSVSYPQDVKEHRVVVQDRRGVMMDKLRATLLRKTIDREQYKLFKHNRSLPKDQRRLPIFGQLPVLTRGCLRMTPRDDFTLAWLQSTVDGLPSLWEGSGGFRVIPENELPRYHTAVIYVPDFGEDREDVERWPFILREFLSELNRDLDVEDWPIYKHLVQRRGQIYNHVLVMGVPPHDVENLKRVDFRLHYSTRSVYVKVKGIETSGMSEARVEVAGGSSSSVGASALADAAADAVPEEDQEWTREEVDRLLEGDARVNGT